MSDELRAQLTKLSIQYIRIGAILDKLEIPNLKAYAEEQELSYATLLRCRSMYRLAKSVKAIITDQRYEEIPDDEPTNDVSTEDLYGHLRELPPI
jgi:hypothetical protein